MCVQSGLRHPPNYQSASLFADSLSSHKSDPRKPDQRPVRWCVPAPYREGVVPMWESRHFRSPRALVVVRAYGLERSIARRAQADAVPAMLLCEAKGDARDVETGQRGSHAAIADGRHHRMEAAVTEPTLSSTEKTRRVLGSVRARHSSGSMIQSRRTHIVQLTNSPNFHI